MTQNRVVILGLDVGEKRLGLAIGDSIGRIAMPLTTLSVDGQTVHNLQEIIRQQEVARLVVGLPRSSKGEETKQSQFSRNFARNLEDTGLPITMQDESMTSVLAENELARRKKPFSKADIDAQAACIILQDYLDSL